MYIVFGQPAAMTTKFYTLLFIAQIEKKSLEKERAREKEV
jgi:hypothetical protein